MTTQQLREIAERFRENRYCATDARHGTTINRALREEDMRALAEAHCKYLAEPATLDQYDAGLLSDFDGGVEWWQDYLRAELHRAHEFYQAQVASLKGE